MAFRLGSKGGASRVFSAWLIAAQALGLAIATPAGAMMLGTGGAAPIEQSGQFDGVGRIECPDNSKQSARDIGTGWVVGSADTVITAAHLLFKRGANGGVTNPNRCVFVLFDSERRVRQIIRIRYGLSPWRNANQRDDSSFDVAVLKLERPAKVAHVPAVRTANSMIERPIELVAFHGGTGQEDGALVTSGRMADFPASQRRFDRSGIRITDASRLFSSSTDSTPGSSGGMYYDEQQQAAVGVHVGGLCDQPRPSYDPGACFNYGLRFDTKIVAMVASVVRDDPRAEQVIVGDEPATVRLAMADRSNG